jgi:hypothetical protein
VYYTLKREVRTRSGRTYIPSMISLVCVFDCMIIYFNYFIYSSQDPIQQHSTRTPVNESYDVKSSDMSIELGIVGAEMNEGNDVVLEMKF